ncbi:MAG: DUF411 domain-containing protein [Deltaproteobacteria bacterium]
MKNIFGLISLVAILTVLGIGGISLFSPSKSDASTTVVVYKTSTCGCCKKWVTHLEKNGFKTSVQDLDTSSLNQIKSQYGVPSGLESCHTATVGGYVVEGHVPADVVKRLLEERPKVAGITVPDMPVGSPGMEGDYSEAYDILTFDAEGRTQIYTSR